MAGHQRGLRRSVFLEPLEDRTVPSFYSELSFPLGRHSEAMDAGDFNRDGRRDVLTANLGTNDVTLLLNDVASGFAAPRHLPLPNNGLGVAVADFNNDRRLDFAVTHDAGVQIVLGNGDGTFQDARFFPLAVPNTTDLVVGDFNGDGPLDLAVTDNGTVACGDAKVHILLGDGDGGFGYSGAYGPFCGSIAVVAADFNNDRNLDLVVSLSSAVSVFMGIGDGTFEPLRHYEVPGWGHRDLAVGDLNSDGWLDFVVVHGSPLEQPGTISVMMNQGDGTFRRPQQFAVGEGSRSLALADFDRDGVLDMVVTHNIYRVGALLLLRGRGDGTFQMAGAHSDQRNERAVLVGDFNGDGLADVVLTARPSAISARVSLIFGRGDGTFFSTHYHAVNASGMARQVEAADFNGDGILDLATVVAATFEFTAVSVLLGTGDGLFRQRDFFEVPRVTQRLLTGDFNGDDIPDLATERQMFLGRGDGTFREASAHDTGGDLMAAGDLNGDSRLDLVIAFSFQQDTLVLLGNGDGTFRPPLAVDGLTSIDGLAAADVNGDGLADLVVTTRLDFPTIAVKVLLSNGDGTFQRALLVSLVDWPAPFIAVSDFNEDGFADLAITYGLSEQGSLGVFLGRGDGTFEEPVRHILGDTFSQIVVADVNGDRHHDLLVGYRFSAPMFRPGVFALLLGGGDGSFGPSIIYPEHPDFHEGFGDLVVGDLNGDSFPDVVGAGGYFGVPLLRNDGVWSQCCSPAGRSRMGKVLDSVARVPDGDSLLAALSGRHPETFSLPGPFTSTATSRSVLTVGSILSFPSGDSFPAPWERPPSDRQTSEGLPSLIAPVDQEFLPILCFDLSASGHDARLEKAIEVLRKEMQGRK